MTKAYSEELEFVDSYKLKGEGLAKFDPSLVDATRNVRSFGDIDTDDKRFFRDTLNLGVRIFSHYYFTLLQFLYVPYASSNR